MTGDTSVAVTEAAKVSHAVRKKSAAVKVRLLAHGVQDSPLAFSPSLGFKEEHYAYDNGNWGIGRGRSVPAEVWLPGGIVSKIHIRPRSTLRLEWDGERILVMEGRTCLSEAKHLSRPRFWDHLTTSGVPTKKLAHFYGATCINFNIYSGCQFFGVDLACQFCSVQATQDLHQAVVIRKRSRDLADTCRLAVENDRVEWFLATGGSYLNSDREFDQHTAVLREVREHLPWGGRLRGNLAMMPPRDLGRLVELFDLGVDHPSFNLEAWPRVAFEAICPGKAKYVGFDHIMTAYDRLVSIYGGGWAWCNFVAGLVPLAQQKEGFTVLAERGVVPGANVYHPDVGSKLANTIDSPSEDYIIELYQHAAALYRQFDYRPFFDAAVLRNSLANEAYEGLL